MRTSLLLFFLSFTLLLQAQDEVISIKVVKKNPIRESKPDTIQPSPMYILESAVAARFDHSFARNGWGGEIGVQLLCHNFPHIPSVELQYCRVNGTFNLSGYTHAQPLTHEQVEKANTQIEYIKMPLVYTFGHWTGPDYSPYMEIGFAPSYLLQVKNDFTNISVNDMHRFNCAYTFGGGIHLGTNLRLGFRFSGDMLGNMRDNSIYDPAGALIGKQNSRKYLIGLSAAYRVGRHFLFTK